MLSIHMLITQNASSLFDEFFLQLKSEFAMMGLGQVHYLGIQVETLSSGLFLYQVRYAIKILQKACLIDCKPLYTPMVSKLCPRESSPQRSCWLFAVPNLYKARYIICSELWVSTYASSFIFCKLRES